jgi:polysaccharide export outer membrane protein
VGGRHLADAVLVRPDGKISLPLLNDLVVVGLPPEELRLQLLQRAKAFLNDPQPSVMVREIHSRNVFITGAVAHPGEQPLNDGLTVLQLIAKAGGVLDFANSTKIVIVGKDNSRRPFDYKANLGLAQTKDNVSLSPGDTVVVP